MLQQITALFYKYFFVRVLFFPENAPHPWDYFAHFIVSLLGVGILFLILLLPFKMLGIHPRIAFFVSAGLMLAIGAIKELIDYNLGRTDMAGDMLGNILGILVALLVFFLVMKIAN